MHIAIADWSSFNQVVNIASQYQVGLEVQEFTLPENLDEPEHVMSAILDGLSRLPFIGMHGPYSELAPASRDPLVRQVARTRFQQSYELARRIGAQHLIIHSGFFPKTYSFDKWVQNSCDFWLDFLQDKPSPGLIHIENVYEDEFAPLRDLIDRVNQLFHDDRLSLNLDIGHVNANSSKSLEEWIAGLGPRIRYVHLSNNGGFRDDHWRLDKGTINLEHVLSLLQTHVPDSIWTVETIVEDIEPSLRWLQERGYLTGQAG